MQIEYTTLDGPNGHTDVKIGDRLAERDAIYNHFVLVVELHGDGATVRYDDNETEFFSAERLAAVFIRLDPAES